MASLIEVDVSEFKIEMEETSEDVKVTRKRKISNVSKDIGDLQCSNCAVCEAPTRYFHYGVASCFACKIFFRRMVLSEIKHKCKYNSRCDLFKGLVCQSCRFDKCILVGMNPRVIQFPTTSKAMEIVDYLMEKKKNLENQYLSIQKTQPKFENATYCYEIDTLLYLETKIQQIRESSYNPTFDYNNIHQILQHSCALANAHKFEKPTNWPINMDSLGDNYDYVFHDLNTFSKGYKRNWLAIDLIIITEAAKALPIYYRLNFEDRIKLLERVAFINTKLLEYYYSGQQNSKTLTYPDGFMPIKAATKSPVFREATKIEHLVFCQNPESVIRVKLNQTEYVLLKSIIYCYSAIPDVSEKGRILLTEQREAYAQILLRYLQSNLGEEGGAKRYLEIISLIPRLFQIAENTRSIWMQMELLRRHQFDFTEPISILLDHVLFI